MTDVATVLKLLERVVAHDTTSRNSNLPLVGELEAYFAGLGIATRRVPNAEGTKASLIATIGPADRPGVVLSAHMDTVPVDGQAWRADPFALRRSGDRVVGRGVTDMKGFLAVCLAAAPALRDRRSGPPVHIALSYDEEIGCLATDALIADLLGAGPAPLACVVGEPTGMEVVIGHKGKRALDMVVTGTPGHSSRAPDYVNAVEYGARIVVEVQALARDLAREGRRDGLYDVPHSTAHVGAFHGGTALNMVPERAEIALEVRTIGGDDGAALLGRIEAFALGSLRAEMRAVSASADVASRVSIDYPALDTPEDADVVVRAKRVAGRNAVAKVAYGTEGGRFSAAGIPTVVVGPGSIADAHQPEESIAVGELAAALTFVEGFVATWD